MPRFARHARVAPPIALLTLALTWAGCGGKNATPSTGTPGGITTPSASSYAISGTVTDDHTFLPIAGATVAVVDGGSAGKSVSTDASGVFQMTGIAPGPTHVRASRSLYLDDIETVNVQSNLTIHFKMASKTPASETPPIGAPVVRAIYLVPTDKHENDVYALRIEEALRGLQAWYRDQLGDGRTFVLSAPAVGVVHTAHDSKWYQGDGSFPAFYYNGLADAHAADSTWPNETLVVYVDADLACGQSGSGALGATVLPSNDLRGLNSETLVKICPNDSIVDVGFCRWVGGLGHELGHAFGLFHPPGCDNGGGCPSQPIMGLGYISYPNATLLDADKNILNASRFLVPFSPPTVPYCY